MARAYRAKEQERGLEGFKISKGRINITKDGPSVPHTIRSTFNSAGRPGLLIRFDKHP